MFLIVATPIDKSTDRTWYYSLKFCDRWASKKETALFCPTLLIAKIYLKRFHYRMKRVFHYTNYHKYTYSIERT